MHPIDHVGIAVENLDSSLRYYTNTYGYALESREKLDTQKVEVAFLNSPGTRIELLAPLDASGTLQKFLNTRGSGLHHICFRVPDISAELTRLESLGHVLIDKQPRPGAHNSLIAFVHPKSCGGVLTELCQY